MPKLYRKAVEVTGQGMQYIQAHLGWLGGETNKHEDKHEQTQIDSIFVITACCDCIQSTSAPARHFWDIHDLHDSPEIPLEFIETLSFLPHPM